MAYRIIYELHREATKSSGWSNRNRFQWSFASRLMPHGSHDLYVDHNYHNDTPSPHCSWLLADIWL